MLYLYGYSLCLIRQFGIIVGDQLVTEVDLRVEGSRDDMLYRYIVIGTTGADIDKLQLQYPADSANTSIPIGVADTISRLELQTRACPDQRFALVGYSQGAIVIHYTVPYINTTIQNSILAVVLFGDPALNLPTPQLGPELQSRLWENCATGDPVRPTPVLRNADLRRSAGTAPPCSHTCRTVSRQNRS